MKVQMISGVCDACMEWKASGERIFLVEGYESDPEVCATCLRAALEMLEKGDVAPRTDAS